MRAHRFISNSVLDPNMRPVNVSLDSTTWELAKGKANFSGWVRRKLLEEVERINQWYAYECTNCKYMSNYQKNRVQGVMKVQDCQECGKTAMLHHEVIE